jgi:hypothetical protein
VHTPEIIIFQKSSSEPHKCIWSNFNNELSGGRLDGSQVFPTSIKPNELSISEKVEDASVLRKLFFINTRGGGSK